MWKRLTSCFICRRETDRSSSPVKLTVSSSHDLDADSKANEENKPEDRNRVQSSTVKNNEKQVLGDVNEGAQGLESEVLRYRYTAKSSTESIDDKEAIPDPKGAHSSSSLKSKGVIDLSEISDGSVCDKEEENVNGEINGKFSADTYFRQSSTTKAETSKGINDTPQQFHEKRHSSSKQAAENERNIDNKQEDKSLNNASHSENEPLRQKQNVFENSLTVNKAAPTVKKNIIPNNVRCQTDEGLTVDKNVKYEGEIQDISGEKDEVSSTRIEGTISNNESHSDLVIEKFSKDLSKCIVDAVVHDSKLGFSASSSNENDVSVDKVASLKKFANILCQSIVQSVLDSNCDNDCDIPDVDRYECYSSNNGDTAVEGDRALLDEEQLLSNEGLFIADEPIEKEKSNEDLHKLAKRLSNEILSDVFHVKRISEQNKYASDLKSTIIKSAISKASSSNFDNNNELHGQLKVYIGEIVRNAVDKAFLTIQSTPTTSVHIDGTYVGKRQLNDVELHSSDSSLLASQQQSDRLQSKRSSVEVGHDDSSDEEDDGNFLSPQKVCNEKEFWRKSLIDDLEDDLNFDETETTHSSAPSSPGASQNLESGMFDDNLESEEEALGTLPNVKVQTPTNKNTDRRRSRLRSVDSTPVLVLDNGSGFLKAGYSNEAVPSQIVSSVVGTPLRYSQDISGIEYSAKPGSVFGDQATGKAGVLRIDYPLKCDLVEKWSDVEGLWDHVFNGLMVIPEHPDFSVLVSQSALSPKKNTEKIAEIMFEHFHMPSLLIVDQLTLSLFSTGYTSGLSFNSGFKSTQAGVVYEGHVLPHTVKQLDIAGYQLTENLKKLLMSLQGFGFRSSSQWQIVDNIKKTMGFFSLDFEGDSKRFKNQAELQKTYELPDGQVIEVGLERFGCAESLFRPMEIGLTQSPAHKLIIDSINSCESELQEQCYKTMSVSGGTTLMKGFTDRLEQELRADDRRFKNFVAPESRQISTWLGGSVMASLPTFQEMVITVDEYAEAGARVVHSKCF